MKLPTPLILFATLALATSAFAKIGERYAQVKSEAQNDRDTVAMRALNWKGAPALLVQYRNGDVIRHVFSRASGREIAFYWWADHTITDREIGIIMRIFKTRWYAAAPIYAQWSNWESNSGLAMGVNGANYLCILDISRLREIPGADDDNDQRAEQNAQPQLRVPTNKNDCLIIATEAYARLKKTSYWARIGAFGQIVNGKRVDTHAVCFFQPTADSQVFMYDEDGSQPLSTQSHDLNDIVTTLNDVWYLKNLPVRATSPQWVGGEGSASTADNTVASDNEHPDRGLQPSRETPDLTTGADSTRKEFVDAADKRYEEWKKSGKPAAQAKSSSRASTSTSSSSDDMLAGIGGLLGFAIVALIIGLPLRYAGIRLWPFAVVSEPVYMLIEAMRRRAA